MSMHLRFRNSSRLPVSSLICTILIALSALATIGAYIFVQKRVIARTNHAFEVMTDSYADQLSLHMERYGDILYATRALFAVTNVNAQSWKQFISSQNASERYAGMKSLAYAEVVAPQDIAAYEQRLQGAQNTPIQIKPLKADGDYAVVSLHEQTGGSGPNALGFNIASDELRSEALQQARDTRQITATAPLSLVTDKSPGFLLLLPLSERPGDTSGKIYGYGIAAFAVQDMINKTLARDPRYERASLTITDVSGAKPQRLYTQTRKHWERTVSRTVTTQVANRKWQLAFQAPTGSIVMIGDRLAPTIVLLSGIAFIVLLCILAAVTKKAYGRSR